MNLGLQVAAVWERWRRIRLANPERTKWVRLTVRMQRSATAVVRLRCDVLSGVASDEWLQASN